MSAALKAAGPWLALVILAIWTRELHAGWLALASAAFVAGLLARTAPSRARAIGLFLLICSVVAAFVGQHQLDRLSSSWEEYWAERRDNLQQQLEARIDDLLDRGDEGAVGLALLADGDSLPSREGLAALRRATGMSTAIVYDRDGVPLVWDGSPRGQIPDAARYGDAPYVYDELPLFSYLYFTAPIRSTGGTALVGSVLRAELPGGLHADLGDLVSRFRSETGDEIRISTAERAREGAVFDLKTPEGQTLFSIGIVRPTEAARRSQLIDFWLRVVGALVLAAWLALALATAGESRAALHAVVSFVLLAAVLPWRELLAQQDAFSSNFVLPTGLGDFRMGTVTLGRLLAFVAGASAIVGFLPFARRFKAPSLFSGLVVALGFPLAAFWVSRGPSPEWLAGIAGSTREWIFYQLALTGVLALVAMIAFASARERPAPARPWRLAAACLLAIALAAAAAWHVRAQGPLPVWAVALWALPAVLAAPVLAGAVGLRQPPLLLWTAAVALSATAALPHAWSSRVEARMAIGERQLLRLGAGVDPYLQYLLEGLGGTVQDLYQEGAGPVELLYRGWTGSGLSDEGYPVWLTLWSPGGIPQEELRIGVGNDARPPLPYDYLEQARQAGAIVQRFDDPSVHYMALIPLPDGWFVSAVVPPVMGAVDFSPLGPLFGSLAGERPEPLQMVPLLPNDPLRLGAESTTTASDTLSTRPTWSRTPAGARGEVALVFPDARYRAQYEVDLPGYATLIARGTLLLAIDLLVLLFFWSFGRIPARGARLSAGWRGLFTSFRARVTLALFGFFLLSNVIFGTLAFNNIKEAAESAAQVLAERVAEDAAGVYLEVGSMELLAGRFGGDLLVYRNGQLDEAAADELVELGLYDGLLPYPVEANLGTGRELVDVRIGELGRWQYVTAYRRLADGGVLAVPVSLQAGATAVRRQEVAHFVAFAIVAGAALSLLLALMVGRALTEPIRTLQVASERVGSGNLQVRLPEERSDEFGWVFAAFNRMVRRLGRARRQLVRTTRRTQAIVEDAATGVIAFDAQGRVALINPRAEALIGGKATVGHHLSENGGPAGELVDWVERYFRDGLRDAASEFQFGDRRIHVRARRITRAGGPQAGAVLSLEDVTDELRTERILAWGEMARQVAHEVKNPLTPIKLSIQHIQRAHRDRRPDFDDILGRNADAMLKEIDRLAAIATSFSRFGAPGSEEGEPLEPVEVERVVSEVLALYDSGEGGIRFVRDVPAELPPVSARESEMKEVLINLLENARAATPATGTVRIEARAVEEGVTLRVRDDGSGIPPEVLPRVFEPHFSTRSSGTGLGLAIVRRLVESWNAVVSVESEPGRGTAVHIWLRPWR